MRLLFVADGRSPTFLSWLRYWVEGGQEVHLVSTFPCEPPPGLASFHILPVAFARLGGSQAGGGGAAVAGSKLAGRLRSILRPLRYYLGPANLGYFQSKFLSLVKAIQPDLVHAMRIPFEGMLTAVTPPEIPLILSIWGNDLSLHAHGARRMGALTRSALQRADGLFADTARDIRLGGDWGFRADKPSLVVPGGGGIRLERISSLAAGSFPEPLPDGPLIVNPRGQRPGSLRQDIFFKSIPRVLERFPRAVFICPPLKGDPEADRLVAALGIGGNTRLWPRLEQAQLWALYRQAQVFVSPSLHDGTPNSLLEAMACGCFPVTGDVESLREWITPGVNGLLADATDAESMAGAIITALENEPLRKNAARENARIISQRAEYGACMATVDAFYQSIVRSRTKKENIT
jgi:glycosyltransferase involved in cell wall biosynthesis